MLDRDTEYAPQASDGYTSNHPSSTKELDDNPSYHQPQWSTSTTAPPYFEGEIPWADRQATGYLPQTELPHQVPQDDWNFAGESDAPDYDHHLANTRWAEWQCQTPSVENNREGARADGEQFQWTSASTQSGTGGLDFLNNDGGAEDVDDNREMSGTYIPNNVGSAELLAPHPSFQTLPPEGLDKVFFNGILSRERGHYEELDMDTSALLSRLQQPDRELQSHMEATMSYQTSSDSRDWTMPHYDMASAPQSLPPTEGQQQMEVFDAAPTYDFQYQVREDTPLVAQQTELESRSM